MGKSRFDGDPISPSNAFISYLLSVICTNYQGTVDGLNTKIDARELWGAARMDVFVQTGISNCILVDAKGMPFPVAIKYGRVIDVAISVLSPDVPCQPDLEILGLSQNTIDDLNQNQIIMVSQLCFTSETYLMHLVAKGKLGRKSVNEVKERWAECGFQRGTVGELV